MQIVRREDFDFVPLHFTGFLEVVHECAQVYKLGGSRQTVRDVTVVRAVAVLFGFRLFDRLGFTYEVFVSLHVFPEAAGIRVALRTTGYLALVWFVHLMGARMLEAIAGIRIGLIASDDRTHVRLFAAVRSSVDLQVLRSRERLFALEALVRFLVCVRSDMDQHLISRIETSVVPGATFPSAVEEPSWAARSVYIADVRGELIQTIEFDAARSPATLDLVLPAGFELVYLDARYRILAVALYTVRRLRNHQVICHARRFEEVEVLEIGRAEVVVQRTADNHPVIIENHLFFSYVKCGSSVSVHSLDKTNVVVL